MNGLSILSPEYKEYASMICILIFDIECYFVFSIMHVSQESLSGGMWQEANIKITNMLSYSFHEYEIVHTLIVVNYFVYIGVAFQDISKLRAGGKI
jgi:hypothetical protein